MHRFFAAPPTLKHLQPPDLEDVVSLGTLYPSIPLRVLPVFSTVAGNHLCLYYPRGGGAPFVVEFDHEEDMIFPKEADPEALYADPDRFSHDHPANHNSSPPDDDSACLHVLMNLDAPVPELELLKPLAFYGRELAGSKDDRGFFSRLLSRFGSRDSVARAIAARFSQVQHLRDATRWEQLALHLPPAGAIQALENALVVGTSRPWSKAAATLKSLVELVEEHGDAFDRATVPVHLRAARRLARGD